MHEPNKPEDEEARLKTLHKLNIVNTPLSENFERISNMAKTLFNVPIVIIGLIDEEREWFKSVIGLTTNEHPRAASFSGYTLLQDEVFEVKDAALDERFSDNPLVTGHPNIRFYAGYAITAEDGKKVGSISIIDKKPRHLSLAEINCLKDLSLLVGSELEKQNISFAQARLMKECEHTQRLSLLDPLTRLWNHAGIERILQNQIDYSIEHNEAFWVVMADIDFLNKINETYNKEVGDQVLREAARKIIFNCRSRDTVGRWGDEEFLIILNSFDQKIVERIVERLREKISNLKVTHDTKNLKVTMTFGAAKFDPQNKVALSTLIDSANRALAQGKSSGRNQVCVVD